jgi:arylsulfatase
LALLYQPLMDFDKSIVKYPNIKRAPGGASNDLVPNLKDPANPVPYANPSTFPTVGGGGG